MSDYPGTKPNVLSPAQIYVYARGAGFGPTEAVIATAIALAESGGDANNYNPVPPDKSYGLWQINMIGDMGPKRMAEFSLHAETDLLDPQTNAYAAYHVYKDAGRHFSPWTTYTSGAYQQYIGTAQKGANTKGTIIPGPVYVDPNSPAAKHPSNQGKNSILDWGYNIAPANPLSPFANLASLLSNLADPRFWLRVGQGLAATVLLLIGLGLMFRRDAGALLKTGALM